MMPKVSPKSSLKNGPTTPDGSVWRMSPMFLRTWYQMSGTAAGGVDCFEVDEDRRLAGRRVAAHAVEVMGFLQRALEPLGDLRQGLVDRGAGPAGGDDHGAEGEGRVFAAPQPQERQRARDHRDDHQEHHQRALRERPLRQVRADHFAASSQRTFCPGRSACTPAVTTTSPGASPFVTWTRAAS